MAKVAFLGLGVMGFPMAGHLKNKGGHEVTVYNRTAAKAAKWVSQHGGRHAATGENAGDCSSGDKKAAQREDSDGLRQVNLRSGPRSTPNSPKKLGVN